MNRVLESSKFKNWNFFYNLKKNERNLVLLRSPDAPEETPGDGSFVESGDILLTGLLPIPASCNLTITFSWACVLAERSSYISRSFSIISSYPLSRAFYLLCNSSMAASGVIGLRLLSCAKSDSLLVDLVILIIVVICGWIIDGCESNEIFDPVCDDTNCDKMLYSVR